MLNTFRGTALALAMSLACASPTRAQEIGASAVHLRPTGIDLANATGLNVWLGRTNAGLRFGLTMVEGTRTDSRTMCAGLIPPGESCGAELSDTRGRIRHYGLGYAFRRGSVNQLALIPAVGLSDVRSHTESRETDREFDGRSVSVFGSVAAEFTRRFHADRIGLSAGVDIGVTAERPMTCADCRLFSHYDGYRFGSAYLGASFRLK